MLGEVVNGAVDVAVATVLCAVAVHHRLVFAFGSQDTVVGERLEWVEVEHKHQIATHEGEHLVVVLIPQLSDWQFLEAVLAAQQVYHIGVPVVEELVLQVFAVHQIPLATSIFVAPAVALAWEVDPFGVSPFVAHEVEVAAVDGRGCCQANHLVKRHTAINHSVVVVNHHVPIHFLVDEAENDGLVAHQSLVVALGVTDGFLVGTSVGEFPENGTGLPILVLLLLDGLDPKVGNAHRHTVVEAHAAVFKCACQSWHTAHFLGDGDGVRVHLVNQYVGKGEIGDGVGVLRAVVVVVVAAKRLSQSVAVVEHRGHAVEAETVELVFIEPEFAVAQQEIDYGILSIVEAERIPCRVLASAVAVEVLVVAAVEASQTLHLVFHGVGVYDIHNHRQTMGVCIVDKTLQLFRSAEAA